MKDENNMTGYSPSTAPACDEYMSDDQGDTNNHSRWIVIPALLMFVSNIFVLIQLFRESPHMNVDAHDYFIGKHYDYNFYLLLGFIFGLGLYYLITAVLSAKAQLRVGLWLMYLGGVFGALYLLALTGWIRHFHYSIDSIRLSPPLEISHFNWHKLLQSLMNASYLLMAWFEHKKGEHEDEQVAGDH